ncbi:MAG: endonuclease/exonuclease/phosphatase family protein [Bdellovibrionales bacterium]|nr:endonuclease/exonuclease/phosphatase family protein [Bdellovibrionales bacterium]
MDRFSLQGKLIETESGIRLNGLREFNAAAPEQKVRDLKTTIVPKLKSRLTLMLILQFIMSCTTVHHQSQDSQHESVLSLMAYNVENLFDTEHDADREDFDYLPLSKKQSAEHRNNCKESNSRQMDTCLNKDWSEPVLQRKLERLAQVILQVNGGLGPDILLLEEVENIRVLQILRDQYLKKSNYQTLILIEGPDKRGIDIGLLSRLPENSSEPAKLHLIPFKANNLEDQTWMARSRGILQVNLILPDAETLTVFGVHFPSPHNPIYWREQAIDHLIRLKSKLPTDRMTVAGGDFNISSDEEQKVGQFRLRLAPQWQISHLIGCQDCRGTNYFAPAKSWSFLDALLFHKEMSPAGSAKWYVDPKSIYIPNQNKYQVSRWLTPARFSETSPSGVSDHWPIMAWLRKKELKTQ